MSNHDARKNHTQCAFGELVVVLPNWCQSYSSPFGIVRIILRLVLLTSSTAEPTAIMPQVNGIHDDVIDIAYHAVPHVFAATL